MQNIIVIESTSFGLDYLVEAAKNKNVKILFFTQNMKNYSHNLSYFEENKKHFEYFIVNTKDIKALKSKIDVITKYANLSGIINLTDTYTNATIEVAEHYDLKLDNVDSIKIARDKSTCRNVLFDHKLSCGKSLLVKNGILPENVDYTFPVIVKENGGTGSKNVFLAETQNELDKILQNIKQNMQDLDFNLEPYFRGTVYSAEMISYNGEHKLLSVSGRFMSKEPYFTENVVTLPASLDSKKTLLIEEKVANSLTAIGYNTGFSHVEFCLSKNGIEIIECNPRMGGAFTNVSLCRALNFNFYEDFISIALGEKPQSINQELNFSKYFAYKILNAEKAGIYNDVLGIKNLDSLCGDPFVVLSLEKGSYIDKTADYRGVLGMLVCSGDSSDEAILNLMEADNVLHVDISDI